MTVKTIKRNKKRESILDAAAQAFIQDGYDNVSMDKIAEMAGASKRTVYNHFPSKEDLFRTVLDRFFDEIMALKQITYDAKRSLESQLSDFANAKMDISSNPTWMGLMKMTIGVFITHPELAMDCVKQAEDKGDALVSWLEDATADGRMTIPNPRLAADAFWSMVGGAFFWPAIFYGPMDHTASEEMKEELITMYLARYAA